MKICWDNLEKLNNGITLIRGKEKLYEEQF